MPRAIVALGTNQGDRVSNIDRAIARLKSVTTVIRVSELYETKPMYEENQPAFLNGAVLLDTEFGPLALLTVLKRIEAEIGRVASFRNGPREIDLDLILYGVAQYRFIDKSQIRLQIPHPRLSERRFVLAPMADLWPDLDIPGLGPLNLILQATDSQSADVVTFDHGRVSL